MSAGSVRNPGSTKRPRAAVMLASAAVALLAAVSAGCGGGISHRGHASPTPDGTQLGSLLDRARLPAGWVVFRAQEGGGPESNSGPQLDPAVGPSGSDDSCNDAFGFLASPGDVIGWWSVSNAVLSVQTRTAAGAPVAALAFLYIAAYQPAGDAARTLSMVTSLAARCRSFTASFGPATVSVRAVAGIGSQGLLLTWTAQTAGGTDTAQDLLAATGRYVIGVNTSSAGDDMASQATVEQFGRWLARLVAQHG
jgi:hypothetical protein